MARRASKLLLGLTAFGPSAIAAPRAPAGSWYADFGAAQCVATRNYGSEQNPLFLVLKLPPLGDVLQIGVISKGYAPYATQLDGEILFDGHPPIATELLEFGVKALDQRVLLANLPLTKLAPMRAAASMGVRARLDITLRNSRISTPTRTIAHSFKLSLMPQLLKTLESCAEGLRRAWNIELADGPPTLVRQAPTGSLRSVFSADDYPATAQIKGQSGTLKIAVLVDERGRIADCTIIQTSGLRSSMRKVAPS